jgi:hypothetical protein
VSRKKAFVSDSRQGPVHFRDHSGKESKGCVAIRLSERCTANPIHSAHAEVEECGGRVTSRSAKRRTITSQNDDQKRRRTAR